ncbi:MAG: peptide chain release factor N(5)-glutamine methyltransferase [Thermodesulfobacteriota bacterium]|nr:MAG: peptide chain release factor N(5)-glutamine methyltransferase [Thermodesulfobacteriota bacterium]
MTTKTGGKSTKGLTTRQALKAAAAALEGAGVTEAGMEAEFILCDILDCKRHALFLDPERVLKTEEQKKLTEFIARRKKREPLAYITGEAEFRGLKLKVTGATLIPRPETELLVEEGLSFLKGIKEPAVIELCTGSGCIAISLAVELLQKGARPRIYAVDISAAALDAARKNAEAHGVGSLIEFTEGDLFTPLENSGFKAGADLIISNPPYVASGDMTTLEPEVRDYEPPAALYGGPDGLYFIRRIIRESTKYLKPDGRIVMEIGWGQARAVKEEADKNPGLKDVRIKKDYSGIERIFTARKNSGHGGMNT